MKLDHPQELNGFKRCCFFLGGSPPNHPILIMPSNKPSILAVSHFKKPVHVEYGGILELLQDGYTGLQEHLYGPGRSHHMPLMRDGYPNKDSMSTSFLVCSVRAQAAMTHML